MKTIKICIALVIVAISGNMSAQENYTITEGPIIITPTITDNSTILEVPEVWKNKRSTKKINSGGTKTVTKFIGEFGGLVSISFDQNGVKQILVPKNKKYPKDLLTGDPISNTRDIGNCPTPRECLFETQTETATVLCVVYSPLCSLVSLFF
ncbi:hypothetical protein [uncultured Dokdonia sp.]|uniref:hypothetical protein n=1 Tax=uncultured Dokdonia sp. TaxID=575653 RepID=UPI0026049755|nr:hypothetical protein [uncultured Dokdonia sp.]